jgi:hypothetical protein
VVILWFMWANLANNGDFHLGMGGIGAKITAFFHTMEEKGRELISKVSGTPASAPVARSSDSSDSDSESDDGDTVGATAAAHCSCCGRGSGFGENAGHGRVPEGGRWAQWPAGLG